MSDFLQFNLYLTTQKGTKCALNPKVYVRLSFTGIEPGLDIPNILFTVAITATTILIQHYLNMKNYGHSLSIYLLVILSITCIQTYKIHSFHYLFTEYCHTHITPTKSWHY